MEKTFIKSILLCVAINICFVKCVFPQSMWMKTYGGCYIDDAFFVQQTSDEGYIIAGWRESYTSGDLDPNVWLIKTNAYGDTFWTKTYGGIEIDYAWSAQQTTDKGYIIAGETCSFGAGSNDVWLIKTNSSGDTLCTKTFGGSDGDGASYVKQTLDGGYIIAAWTKSFGAGVFDIWLIKTNSSGDTLWTKTFGGGGIDDVASVQQTLDGGYIIAGGTESFGSGSFDVWLIKTDASGDTLWTKTYGGFNSEGAAAVQQTSDDGYIVAGATNSFGSGDTDVWLIKTNSFGDTVWTKTFGGWNYDGAWSVQQTLDEGYIIAGSTVSFGAGSEDVWLIKTDSFGDTLWRATYGGTGGERASCVQQTSDDGYILVVTTNSFGSVSNDILLIKTDGMGNTVTSSKTNSFEFPGNYKLFQNYPNPFNSSTTISYSIPHSDFVTLTIYDILGKEIQTSVNEFQKAKDYSIDFKTKNLTSGLYLYKLQVGNKIVETKKMLLVR